MTTLTSSTETWKTRPHPAHDPDSGRLAALLQFSRGVGSCRDVKELLQSVSRHAASTFDADRACLYLFDEARFELWTCQYSDVNAPSTEIRIPADHGLCGRVFATHRPICMVDTFDESLFARDRFAANDFHPYSMLLAPIMHGAERCLGVLLIMDRRLDHYSVDDLPMLGAVAGFIGVALENLNRLNAERQQFSSFVSAVSAALDARDILTATHSRNVANYAVGIGTILGLPKQDLQRLRIAGLLHDIGKVGVPETVLTKAGRLSSAELEEMQQHAQHTKDILSGVCLTDELQGVDFIAAAHHERLDGSGYPDRLQAEQLPLSARIMAVADIYDALTQTRHYRPGMSMHEALTELDAMTPHQLDRQCVAALKAFLRCGPWPAPECL